MLSKEPFELEKYLRLAGGTRPEAFDWSDTGDRLDPEALFCLGYMMDIESHTIIYMKELLSTSVVRDPSITAFLSCWVSEEFFHSQILKRFLVGQGVAVDDARFAALRREPVSSRITASIATILSHLTRHFPAVHMTWGAVNELSTLTGYQALVARTGHPFLTRVLQAIVKDERRHFAFYFNQARQRLRYPAAQRLTSFLLRRFWAPVGSAVRGDSDMRRMCTYLFEPPESHLALTEHDRMIASLPGLGWFDLASRYCAMA